MDFLSHRPNKRDEVQTKQGSEVKLLVLFSLSPFLIEALANLGILLRLISVANDSSYPEGASVYAFLEALKSSRLYSLPFQTPFNEQMYGPAFYLVGMLLARIGDSNPLAVTIFGRVLSFACFLGSGALLCRLSWRLEKTKHWVFAVLIMGLACQWAVPFASSVRPDSLCIFLAILSLVLYLEADGRSRLIFLAGIVLALACLTKQSMLPLLVALMIDGVIAKDFSRSLYLSYGAIPFSCFIVGLLWFRRDPFWENLTAVGDTTRSWLQVIPTAAALIRTNEMALLPMFIALIGAVANWWKPQYRAIILANIVVGFASIAALANTGGYANYFILPWLLMVILLPAGLIRIVEWSKRSLLIPPGIFCIGILLLIHQRKLIMQGIPDDLNTYKLSNLRLLSDSPYLEARSIHPELLDPFLYHQFSLRGFWPISSILKDIDEQKYDLVLLSGYNSRSTAEFFVLGFRGVSYWGSDLLTEVADRYKPLCQVSNEIALVPKERREKLGPDDLAAVFGKPCVSTVRT